MKTRKAMGLDWLVATGACLGVVLATLGQNEPAKGEQLESTQQLSLGELKFVKEALLRNRMAAKLGALGQGRAQTAAVKDLATIVVADRTRAVQELGRLAQQKGLQLPDESTPTSQGETSSASVTGHPTISEYFDYEPSWGIIGGGFSSPSSTSLPTSSLYPAIRYRIVRSPAPRLEGAAGRIGHLSAPHTRPASANKTLDSGGQPFSAGVGEDEISLRGLNKLEGKDFDRAFIGRFIDDYQKEVDLYDRMTSESQDKDVREYATATLPMLRMHLRMAQTIFPPSRTSKNSIINAAR